MPKTYAPRLYSGDSRIEFKSRFPEPIKEGLRAIAKKEKKSINWVIEECIIDYFSLRTPRYRINKKGD